MPNEPFAVVWEFHREYPPVESRLAAPAWLTEICRSHGRSEETSPGGTHPGGACTACAVGSCSTFSSCACARFTPWKKSPLETPKRSSFPSYGLCVKLMSIELRFHGWRRRRLFRSESGL